jgi:choline monooxygenase
VTRELTPVSIDVDRLLEAGHTLPASWYADPEVYRLENERIFDRSWHLVCRQDRLAKTGDHVVSMAGRIPVVVTVDRDGELHGFVNVCRHRGHPVAVEDGCRRTLQCRYHSWTYGLDGSLRSAPRLELEDSFDKASLGLLPVALDTWRDWVFVNPDVNAASLATTYPRLEPLAHDKGLDISGYEYGGRWTYEVGANWKAWVDNTIECYHCPTIHSSSYSAEFDVDPGAYELVNDGLVMGQFTRFSKTGIAQSVTGADGDGGRPDFRFIYVWPTSFVIQDRFVGFSGTVVPTGPETCRFVADSYTDPAAPPELLSGWLDMWNRTLEEDKDVVAVQQPTLGTGVVPYGRLTATESPLKHFHRVTWEAIAPAADGL